jgi:hypothetical protein
MQITVLFPLFQSAGTVHEVPAVKKMVFAEAGSCGARSVGYG